MKKSLILSVMGLFLTVSAFAAPTSNRNPIPEPSNTGIKLSSLRMGSTEDDPIRVFKLVRFTGAGANQAAVVSGDVLVYDTNSADSVSVRYTTTSADGAFAGIAVTAIGSADGGSTTAADDIGHKNWGWICVHGPALANATAGGTNGNAIGDFFITSTDSGKITTSISFDSAANVAYGLNQVKRVSGNKGGFFLTAADGTSTQYKVYVENV